MDIVKAGPVLLTCETCPYCCKSDEMSCNICRFNPPQAFMMLSPKGDGASIKSVWPPTPVNGWCSHHPSRQDENKILSS
jgi:hypothetical protein